MFFARLVVWVGEFLPENSKFTRNFCMIFNHNKCKQKVIAWHRAELEKLDLWYCLQQDSLRLVAAREKARAEGIGPLDQRYPSVIDGEEEARVHADVLAMYRKTGGERMKRLEEAVKLMDDGYPQERVDAVTTACMSASRTRPPD